MNPRFWREDTEGAFPNADPMGAALHFEKGGGGKGEAMMMMMMMQQQQQEAARAAMEKEQERQRAAQEKQIQEAKEAQALLDKKEKAKSMLARTIQGAQSYGSNQLAQYGGTDKYGLLGAYGNLLSGAQQMIPEDEANPQQFINAADLWNQAATQVRGTQRSNLKKQYNSLYNPGFETEKIADEMDDPFLQSIIGEQETQATSDIDRARARGQLNDDAYAVAQRLLGQQRAAANTQAQSLGQTVLQKYRDSLTNRASNLNQRIQDWDFNDVLDFAKERQGLNTELGRDRTNLEQDIRGTLGDRDFFNIDLLLGKARNKAGTTNAGPTSPLLNAFASTPTTATQKPLDDTFKKDTGVF